MVKVLLWLLVLYSFGAVIAAIVRWRGYDVDSSNFVRMLQVAALCLIGLALTGCASVRPDGGGSELKHDSVLLRGEPFTDREINGRKVEDSLDVWNNYLYWDRPGFYAELGLGLKLREGGFYSDGSPIIVNARVGKRFKFGE